MSENVLRERIGAVALLTMNRPGKLNCLDYPLIDEMLVMLDVMEADDGVRAVILTGAGDKAFCSGADIDAFAPSVRRGPEVALREFVRRGHRLTSRIESFPKPIIVAVNGIAHGGGCEITEAAPLAIASENAEFCKAEITLGFAPPFGGTQRLPRNIGRKRALQYILTADRFSAKVAEAYGLVNYVVPREILLPEALALANKIIDKSPLAVAACPGSVTRGLNTTIDEGLAIEAGYFARMVATNDIHEGISAWIEKRKPTFTGT